MAKKYDFSQKKTIFHEKYLPEDQVLLAGYAALIEYYELQAPLPDQLSAISHKHKIYQKDNWKMFTPRHTPSNSLYGHLKFALKYEGIYLWILKALFNVIKPIDIINIVIAEPTSTYSRRIWFLYEWLQGIKLEIPDTLQGVIVNVMDDKLQYTGKAILSKRHRVMNNLPGVPAFCPTIQKTKTLENFIKMKLNDKARRDLGKIHPDMFMRAAAFMMLKDSKASFAIEGEIPPQNRAERWGKAIGQAGKNELSHDEFCRLQEIIISDFRFIYPGYRIEGGFVGEHERSTSMPIPDHISAKAEDIDFLMQGLIETDKLLKESNIDAVLAATIIAFGFVFIHPFEDGNGRIHRYLIHHVLADKNFSIKNIVFPISAVILDRIQQYKEVLENFSRPRLKFITWRPTARSNIEVLNDTKDLYRYFDATQQAEFLYSCIQETIEKTLPEEVSYLKKYDTMKIFIKNYIDMPDRLIDLLIRFLNQGNGILSKRAKRKEFSALTSSEIETLQEKYMEVFYDDI